MLSQALNTKGVMLDSLGRTEECHALQKHALEVALEQGLHSAAMRAYFNLAGVLYYLDGQAGRLRARLATTSEATEDAEPAFKTSAATFREYGIVCWLGVTLLEYGEWLAAGGRSGEAEPLLTEAREVFERLEATPWLERAAQSTRAPGRAEAPARTQPVV